MKTQFEEGKTYKLRGPHRFPSTGRVVRIRQDEDPYPLHVLYSIGDEHMFLEWNAADGAIYYGKEDVNDLMLPAIREEANEEYNLNAIKASLAELNPNDLAAVEALAAKLRVPLECEEYPPAILALKLVSAEWGVHQAKWNLLPACECAACGIVYEHHCGSTPCCGSVAYVVKEAAHE